MQFCTANFVSSPICVYGNAKTPARSGQRGGNEGERDALEAMGGGLGADPSGPGQAFTKKLPVDAASILCHTAQRHQKNECATSSSNTVDKNGAS